MGRQPLNTAAAVEDAVVQLGRNVATARMRRKWRQADLADKAGVHVNTVRSIEAGAPGTGIAAYAAALWALGLVDQLRAVAGPERDLEGETLAAARLGERVRPSRALDNDF